MKAIVPRDVAHLIRWCAIHNGHTPLPAERRFSIGVYQIAQGNQWAMEAPVKWQSYCAASIHFLCAANRLWTRPELGLVEDIEESTTRFAGWENLVTSIGLAQQQLIYREETNPRWKSRYSAEKLEGLLGTLTEQMWALVPPGERVGCLADEIALICGL